jgi:hypothetical protein
VQHNTIKRKKIRMKQALHQRSHKPPPPKNWPQKRKRKTRHKPKTTTTAPPHKEPKKTKQRERCLRTYSLKLLEQIWKWVGYLWSPFLKKNLAFFFGFVLGAGVGACSFQVRFYKENKQKEWMWENNTKII